MRIHSVLLLLLVLASCQSERQPYSMAPTCPSWPYCPKTYPRNPCQQMERQLSCDVPVCYPEAGQTTDLCQLIGMALQNSPKTRESWADARIAAAQYGVARADYYPDFNMTGFAQATRYAEFFGRDRLQENAQVSYGPDLTMSYLVLDFGARKAKNQMFCWALQNANWTHNRQIQSVVQAVAVDYYNYLAKDSRVKAQEETLRDAQTTLDAASAKHRVGIADLADEMAARTQVARQELTLLTDRESKVDAYTRLATDVGFPADIPIAVDEMPAIVPTDYLRADIEALLCRAYTCRPDLLAALADVRSECANVHLQKQNRWPKITFEGDLGRTYWNSGTHDDYDGTAAFKFTVPLFKGWYYENKIREARAELEKSRALLRETQINIAAQVVQSYEDFLLSAEKVAAGKEYVRAAKITFEANLRQYQVGVADITTVVQALANLADARNALIDAKQNWFTSLTDLSYAMGTLAPPGCQPRECKLRECPCAS